VPLDDELHVALRGQLKALAEQMGYKVFPQPTCTSPGVYTNPDGMQLAPCNYCGFLRTLRLPRRRQGQSDSPHHPERAEERSTVNS